MPTPRSSDLGLRRQVTTPIVRAVLATAHAGYTPDRNVGSVVRRLWPRDQDMLAIVERAATSPAATTTATWAQELAVNHVCFPQIFIPDDAPLDVADDTAEIGLELA
jgi:hypothetical protein